jgi:hypothetical protein
VTQSDFDPLVALRVLATHAVDYVVVGGFAADLLGAGVNTNDLDICYDRSPENLDRLVAALGELDAKLRVARVEEELPFVLDAKTLAAGDCFTFVTRAGALDILGTPRGTNGFRDLATRATTLEVGGGLDVRVVALDDLIRMKVAAGRAKDYFHLEILAALQEVLAEQGQAAPSNGG